MEAILFVVEVRGRETAVVWSRDRVCVCGRRLSPDWTAQPGDASEGQYVPLPRAQTHSLVGQPQLPAQGVGIPLQLPQS